MKLKFYAQKGITLMNEFEQITGKLFSDCHTDLETNFWEALDSKDQSKICFYVNRMGVLIQRALEREVQK